ncbi:hypothetical protein [Sphingopyxis sp. PET50]|uniref:hypothetical protein n=1 Tax=Sphingopyxis sp. PET50 TaxID=2976533 RepID=UPI0021B0258E|nr:hypothetical protein [Sphingopyxis sp. PET50]
MSADVNIAAIHAVRDAATALTLACAEIVGPVSMAISLPGVRSLGEPVPPAMRRQVRKIQDKERNR